MILGFLTHLETQRHNVIRTRNARLAAIRAFLHYAALQEELKKLRPPPGLEEVGDSERAAPAPAQEAARRAAMS